MCQNTREQPEVVATALVLALTSLEPTSHTNGPNVLWGCHGALWLLRAAAKKRQIEQNCIWSRAVSEPLEIPPQPFSLTLTKQGVDTKAVWFACCVGSVIDVMRFYWTKDLAARINCSVEYTVFYKPPKLTFVRSTLIYFSPMLAVMQAYCSYVQQGRGLPGRHVFLFDHGIPQCCTKERLGPVYYKNSVLIKYIQPVFAKLYAWYFVFSLLFWM